MKLVKLALAAGAVAAVWAFVPVGGRTMSERWGAAGSAERFAERSWAELREAFRDERAATPAPQARPKAKSPKEQEPRAPRAAEERRAARPNEGHTEEDRRALDEIVADRLKR